MLLFAGLMLMLQQNVFASSHDDWHDYKYVICANKVWYPEGTDCKVALKKYYEEWYGGDDDDVEDTGKEKKYNPISSVTDFRDKDYPWEEFYDDGIDREDVDEKCDASEDYVKHKKACDKAYSLVEKSEKLQADVDKEAEEREREKQDKKVCEDYNGKWKDIGGGDRGCTFENDDDAEKYGFRPGYSLDSTGSDAEYGIEDLVTYDDEGNKIYPETDSSEEEEEQDKRIEKACKNAGLEMTKEGYCDTNNEHGEDDADKFYREYDDDEGEQTTIEEAEDWRNEVYVEENPNNKDSDGNGIYDDEELTEEEEERLVNAPTVITGDDVKEEENMDRSYNYEGEDESTKTEEEEEFEEEEYEAEEEDDEAYEESQEEE